MNSEEALRFILTRIPSLTDKEIDLFKGVWAGQSYKEIYVECFKERCSLAHLRANIAASLWVKLRSTFGPDIRKSNLRGTIERAVLEAGTLANRNSIAEIPDSSLKDEGESFRLTKRLKMSVQYQERTALFFPEEALELEPEQLPLEMVQIPHGSFVMGSPEDELGRTDDEGPQHEVTISQPFFLAKYPVTQAQWRAVAALPQVEQWLKSNPSHFKGDNRPVEHVSWLDAVEFCQRLEQATHRPYRLPSEVEWEYACRAGTTGPFHVGASITTNLANHRGINWKFQGEIHSGAYGSGPLGEWRKQTTEVGKFEAANAFGLFDMHGNVWEWCQDRWHCTQDAPRNSSDQAMHLQPQDRDMKNRVLRGGSWRDTPDFCRSASRLSGVPDLGDFNAGFRVACSGARP